MRFVDSLGEEERSMEVGITMIKPLFFLLPPHTLDVPAIIQPYNIVPVLCYTLPGGTDTINLLTLLRSSPTGFSV